MKSQTSLPSGQGARAYLTAMRACNPHWPLPTSQALRALRDELKNARHHFPDNRNLLMALEEFVDELRVYMKGHDKDTIGPNTVRIAAVEIYSQCIAIAALAIRIAEEGDAAHTYARSIIETGLFRDPA